MARKWICTVCNYVHEGAEPPEVCPVCGAPRDEFEPLGELAGEAEAGGADTEIAGAGDAGAGDAGAGDAEASDATRVPETLEQVRERARDRMRGLCAVYPLCDGVIDHLCNREAYGNPIGLGGVGTGAAFANNVSSLARLRLRTRLVGPHFEPDTRSTFLGRSLALPVMGSSTAGFGGHELMDDREFCDATVQGCLEAGSLAWRGDTEHYSVEHHGGLDAIEARDGRGIVIFKPRSQGDLKRLVERAVGAGCVAVGVDLDGCGSTNMARAGQPVYRKSVAELRELVQAAAELPFVAKGIMDPDDAEACLEAGVKVVAVSNHGGRVLDHTPGVAEVLPQIVERVAGRATITADGGVRTGFDVLKLLALGADAVLMGRDVIRGAVGGGARGVALQLERVQAVLAKAMLMTGCPTLSDIDDHVLC
jgi:isopentenyl diphosphate isomerase/L-lactate dehydrogenase-like FMN-dependent dehydrogenase